MDQSSNQRFLGVDVGGTKTACGIFIPSTGKFRRLGSWETPRSVEGMVELIAKHSGWCQAIGVGFPGKTDNSGVVNHAPNNQWAIGKELFEIISGALMMPVYYLGDLDGAAWGVAPSCKNPGRSLVITDSTGINTGYIVDGKVIGGSETGHTCIDYSDLAFFCLCGLQGCVEAYASGTAAAAFVERELFLMDARDREWWRTTFGTENNMILDGAYTMEQPWAQRIYWTYVLPALGRLLGTIHNNTPFDELWWMGTFAQHMLKLPAIKPRLRAEMQKHMVSKNARSIPFRMLPKNAPTLGPARFAYERYSAA